MACNKKSSIKDFVKNHNIRDKYMSELAVCEKVRNKMQNYNKSCHCLRHLMVIIKNYAFVM